MARESLLEKKARAKKIVSLLFKMYPESKCSLDYNDPLQLLIATILSAQCTDARVNMVTPKLFSRFRSLKDFADADITELEKMIRSTGFYRNKAKNIKACCKALIENHKGVIPESVEELSELPGVGRKTANVVLGNVFGVPSMVVDTHVTRITNLLKLAKGANAVDLEKQLMEVIEKKHWVMFSHLLISHGRTICIARRPKCGDCKLSNLCPSKI